MKDIFLKIKTIHWVIIIISLDIVLSLLWVILYHPSQSESIVGLGIIMVLFALNAIIALIILILRNFKLSILLFSNSILSPIIFLFIFLYWYEFDSWTSHKHFIFQKDNNYYELNIYTNTLYYEIRDFYNMPIGTTLPLKSNSILIQNDTLRLNDRNSNMYIVDDIIYGFPNPEDKIKMR